MNDRTALGAADVDDQTFAGLVARALGAPSDTVTVLDSSVQEFPYELTSITTAGRYVVRGHAMVDTHRASFAMFVKVVRAFSRSPFFVYVPEELREWAETTVPWRAEPSAYRSDLARRLPGGLSMPVALGVFDLDATSAAIWLPHLEVVERPWDSARYARAAYLLGRMSGSPSVAELARLDLNSTRDLAVFKRGRLDSMVLPQLHGDEIWAHPVVAATFGTELRDRLREAAARADDYVEEALSLPHLAAHGDACPNNLLATAGTDDFTLIDYGFWEPVPAGADLAQLLLGEIQLGHEPAVGLAQRDDALVAAYVGGLREEGCEVPEPVVRRGHALHMMLMNGLSTVLYEGLQGPPAPDLEARMADRAEITRFCLDRLAQTVPAV